MKTEDYLPISSISRLRLGTDGKGLRTLIGVYGCRLRCKYCFNPSSWISSRSPKYLTKKQLYEIVKIDNIYFQATGGGISFGGGEPALYASFIHDFVISYCDKWDVVMETSLCVDRDKVTLLSSVVDRFYVDIKSLDDDIYFAYTGLHNDKVIENLRFLSKTCPEKVTIRIPLIPGFNSSIDQQKTKEEMEQMGFSVNLFTYRTII